MGELENEETRISFAECKNLSLQRVPFNSSSPIWIPFASNQLAISLLGCTHYRAPGYSASPSALFLNVRVYISFDRSSFLPREAQQKQHGEFSLRTSFDLSTLYKSRIRTLLPDGTFSRVKERPVSRTIYTQRFKVLSGLLIHALSGAASAG